MNALDSFLMRDTDYGDSTYQGFRHGTHLALTVGTLAQGVYSLGKGALNLARGSSRLGQIGGLQRFQTMARNATEVKVITQSPKEWEFSLNALSKAGQELDWASLTKAGRALEKHGGREGSVFPKATGNQTSKNIQGQYHLDDIITHPDSIFIRNKACDFKYYAPDGRGAHFRSDGTFKGFVERAYENY